jgi:metal-dependent amidase/aminoacylase/carboxypeptidase family protein
VLSFGKIAGGSATNVIPDEVAILGTFRTFDETWRKEAKALIQKIAAQTVDAYGASVELDIPPGYPSLYNDPETCQMAKSAAEDYLGKDQVRDLGLRMTSEDFAFYGQSVKACFFRLGTNKNNTAFTAPVHNVHFDLDESALATGAGMMSWLAYRGLADK